MGFTCVRQKRPSHRFSSAAELVDVLEQGEKSTWWQEREQRVLKAQPRGMFRRFSTIKETRLIGRDEELYGLPETGEGEVRR